MATLSQGLPAAEIAAPHRSTPSPLAGPAITLRRMTPADAFRWSAERYERKRLLEEACAGMTARSWGAMMRQKPHRERPNRRERRAEAREVLREIGRA